ncbi:MAG: hypothetical protein RJB25_1125, partial [Bacteroidota bacterium]
QIVVFAQGLNLENTARGVTLNAVFGLLHHGG